MNYIPGFSNYLQASVPRYAKGGPARFVEDVMYDDYGMGGYGGDPIMDTYQQAAVMPMTQEAVAPYVEPYQSVPAAQPMTQEAAAPYDLSGVDLSSLYGLNLGGPGNTGLAGLPSLGAGYKPLFEEQLITAPISNKGNPTAYGVDNQFYMSPNNLVRIIDRSTNKVLFEGVGYDAAKKAVEIGQNLTDTMGRSASYQIETGTTPDNYSPVANEKYNPSTISKIGKVAGTVAPLAMALIPGANLTLLGSKLAGGVAAGALIGGASAGLKGDNILKGAALGGLTAYGGQALGPVVGSATGASSGLARAIGTGIGATAGGLATGQNLKNSLLGGAISGGLSYVAPNIQRELGIGGGSGVSVGSGGNIDPSLINVLANTSIPTAVPVGGGAKAPAPTKLAELEPPATIVSASGSPFAAAFPIPASAMLSGALPAAAQPTPEPDKLSEEEDEILVEARKAFNPVSISSPLNTGFMPKSVLPQPMSTETVSPEEILVEARKPFTTNVPVGGALSPEVLRAINGPVEDDIIKVTGRQTTTPALIPGFDTPMPETPEEAEAKKKKLALEDYLRIAGLASGLIGGGGGGSGSSGAYGGSGTGRLNPIFSAKLPSAGGLGSIGMNRTQRPMGDVDWLTYGTRPELSFFDYSPRTASPTPAALPTPVTTPMPGNPAGPIMNQNDPMRFAKGGRSEFAVNGAGTGRSDDIPAVLSDGEYVIDAETVALLGDGSNKAGAKKLDELRIKVRKHKGKKLAKGRFSANAKRPEAYLSGGRI